MGAVVGAGIFIWAGLVLLAGNLGILENLRSAVSDIPALGVLGSVRTWGLILVGAGAIVLLGVLARLALPAYRRPVGGSIIFGLVLIGLGLGNLISWNSDLANHSNRDWSVYPPGRSTAQALTWIRDAQN